MPSGALNWVGSVLAVTAKDIRSEFRTRYALNAILMFALVTLTVISFGLGLLNPSKEILAALFWIILFFAAMSGLAHAFVREEESGTSLVLKLSCPGTVVFFGKMIFNLILLGVLAILIVPLFIILLKIIPADWGIFLLALIPGIIGLAGATTIVAAVVSQATVKGALFTVLSFPILLPLLVAVIEITEVAFLGGTWDEIKAPLQLLIAYDVVMTTLSVMLFDFVWRQ